MSEHTIDVTEIAYIDPRAGSDKFFRTFVYDSVDGAVFRTQYGRNGTDGTLTKPVAHPDRDKATAAAEKRITSKVAKGYQPVGVASVEHDGEVTDDVLAGVTVDGSAQDVIVEVEPVEAVVVAPADGPVLGRDDVASLRAVAPPRDAVDADVSPDLPTRPMLAQVAQPGSVESLLGDPGWVAQRKYDGDRLLVEVADGHVRALNRQGKAKQRNVPVDALTPFTALRHGRWVFDGEVVGSTLVLFDLALATDGAATFIDSDSPFDHRYGALVELASLLGLTEPDVVVAPVAASEADKQTMLTEANENQHEGVMFRRTDGPYEQGRRSTGMLKHKFIHDADVVVTALHTDRESATLAVHGDDGNLVEVGSASTIGKADVRVGDVWTVMFMYVIDPNLPRMVQPRLTLKRHDKDAAECMLDQFAHAGTDKAVV